VSSNVFSGLLLRVTCRPTRIFGENLNRTLTNSGQIKIQMSLPPKTQVPTSQPSQTEVDQVAAFVETAEELAREPFFGPDESRESRFGWRQARI
jgi:hypothetical protein